MSSDLENPYASPTSGGEAPASSASAGHPRGLYTLFFAEMWERFCFYGMRALLTIYLTKALLKTDIEAAGIYGAYAALVYAAPVVGGKLADSLLGYRVAVIIGALMMALGSFVLVAGDELYFFLGMATIIVGNGFFKANISTMVGKLYEPGDPKRDAGFTIFYMGINVGAFVSTLVCTYVGETYGYVYGFGLAGIGMLLGLVVFMMGRASLQGKGEPPDPQRLFGGFVGPLSRFHLVILGSFAVIPALYLLLYRDNIVFWLLVVALGYTVYSLVMVMVGGDRVQRDRIIVLFVLMVFNVAFWACFEQAGSSLTLFADRNVNRMIGTFEVPASQTQTFNPLYILVFGAIFSALWVWLDKRGMNPSIPAKFALALIQLGCGYALILLAVPMATADARIPLVFLGLIYLLHTTGELCLSPIGLSMVTKLAPAELTGTVMGAWFLTFAFAHNIGGELAKGAAIKEGTAAAESLSIYAAVYSNMGFVTIGLGVLLLLLSRPLTRMMHGVN